MSEAVKRELSQVDSLIQDLAPTSFKAEPTVNDRAIEDLRNRNLQLELDLARTKLELLKLQLADTVRTDVYVPRDPLDLERNTT